MYEVKFVTKSDDGKTMVYVFDNVTSVETYDRSITVSTPEMNMDISLKHLKTLNIEPAKERKHEPHNKIVL